jgi:hypothetical protein
VITSPAVEPTAVHITWAPLCGSLLLPIDHHFIYLVVCSDRFGITAGGLLVELLDRPRPTDEGLVYSYANWKHWPVRQLDADQMSIACCGVEEILNLPEGTVSAETIEVALLAAARSVSQALLSMQGFVSGP